MKKLLIIALIMIISLTTFFACGEKKSPQKQKDDFVILKIENAKVDNIHNYFLTLLVFEHLFPEKFRSLPLRKQLLMKTPGGKILTRKATIFYRKIMYCGKESVVPVMVFFPAIHSKQNMTFQVKGIVFKVRNGKLISVDGLPVHLTPYLSKKLGLPPDDILYNYSHHSLLEITFSGIPESFNGEKIILELIRQGIQSASHVEDGGRATFWVASKKKIIQPPMHSLLKLPRKKNEPIEIWAYTRSADFDFLIRKKYDYKSLPPRLKSREKAPGVPGVPDKNL